MIYFIYFVILVSFIDTFVQLPIISPYALSLGATSLLIGITVGIYSFSNMIGNVFAGLRIDKNGAKIVLVLGMFVTGLVLFTYLLADTPGKLIFVRFLHGVSGGFLVPAAFTMLANQNEKKQRGKSMAFSGAAVGSAAIIGPAFGGIVTSKFGIEWVFITIGCLLIITSILIAIFLPNTEKKMTRRLDGHTGKSLTEMLRNLPLINSYLGAFSLMFSQGVLAFMLPLKVESLQLGAHLTGMLMSVFGITAILVFLLPVNKIFDRFAHAHTMVLGILVIVASLLTLSQVTGQLFMFIVLGFYGVGFALVFPSINAMIVEQTNQEERGKAFGLFYAFFSLGIVGGSLLTGIIAASPNKSFIIAAFILFFNGLLMVIIDRAKRPAQV